MNGQQLAMAGMESAARHADAVSYDWSREAERHIVAHARACSGPFTIEEVRRIAYNAGLDKPPVEGAWGKPTKSLIKQGFLREAGFRVSANASQHGKPVRLWEVAR